MVQFICLQLVSFFHLQDGPHVLSSLMVILFELHFILFLHLLDYQFLFMCLFIWFLADIFMWLCLLISIAFFNLLCYSTLHSSVSFCFQILKSPWTWSSCSQVTERLGILLIFIILHSSLKSLKLSYRFFYVALFRSSPYLFW